MTGYEGISKATKQSLYFRLSPTNIRLVLTPQALPPDRSWPSSAPWQSRSQRTPNTAAAPAAWEQRACELARQDTLYAFMHFFRMMNRTNEKLKIDDYVGKADAEGWELARQRTRREAPSNATSNILATPEKRIDGCTSRRFALRRCTRV
jgi:hypothetical protein